MSPKRFYNIDFLRFILCFSICLFHSNLICKDIIKDVPNFYNITKFYRLGCLCVDFFFIISGFFWGLSAEWNTNLYKFVVKKVIRFWPTIAIGVIICALLALANIIEFDICANIENLLFLNGLGFGTGREFHGGLGNLHPTWFISVLFWVLLFYQYLYNNFPKKILNLFMALSIVILLSYIIRTHHGATWGRSIKGVFPIINNGIQRGIYACAIGYFIWLFYQRYKTVAENINMKISIKITLSLINLLSIGILFYNLFYNPLLIKHVITLIICFIITFVLFIFNKDYISAILNKRMFGCLGLFSYSIFVTHAIPIEVLKKQVFIKENVLSINTYPITYFAGYVIISILLGVTIYYFVEKIFKRFLCSEQNKTEANK